MKPYYQDDYVTLYNGDCQEILPTIKSNTVDIVFTDPPYGHNNNNGDLIHRREVALGLTKKVTQDEARPIANDSMEEMKFIVDFALSEFSRVLKKESCCCCCCCCGGGPKPTFAWVANRMDTKGLSFFQAVVWDKGGLGMGWKYRRNYEFVMVAHRKGGKLKWETTSSGKDTANVVRINKIIPSKNDHPTPKPVELVAHFLTLHGRAGDLCLDPFAGAGTTLEACKLLGIKCIGIELEEKYCEMAARRCSQDILPLDFNNMGGLLS
jgi:site-specific DNA-methyltransferase (adenine-specific)